MTAQSDIKIEQVIHDLLCEQLDDADRLEILQRAIVDKHVRSILEESVQSQELARKAFGYPLTDDQLSILSRLMRQVCR